ncbi:MAG: tRNA uridine-5-carboxymethylaminomethyl(34) synthesis GTPase MnmE [Ruminococcaceae bacterium]|nr:tRNA uridine-5-carboxymethylaminomethyl(34) synthesis GTPase MnmE [Oscillospiraceae bacterium]
MIGETVAAISTAKGKGGIAVIRISGEKSAEIIEKCFVSKGKSPVENPRRAVFGSVVDGEEVIDTAVCVYFLEGASFTGEASAEISCHGGTAVTRAVLEAVFKAGAKPAEAGEFTRRAFINGRLLLTEAEAVGRLIDADTESRRRLASGALRGSLKDKTEKIRNNLADVLSALYAVIDYPDEDIGNEGEEQIESVLSESITALEALLRTYRTGSAVAEGVVTVICGSPNCGKSTLYNLLCRAEKAIVTDVAGTTRDTLWETVDAGGITLRLADTAGIRKTGDTVESIGVDRAKGAMREAELIISVFDGSRPLTEEERSLLSELSEMDCAKIAVINKSDTDTFNICSEISLANDKTVVMSAKYGEGEEALYSAISGLFNADKLTLGTDAVLWEARHKATVESVIALLSDARTALVYGDPADAVCTLCETALSELSLLDGRGVTEDIVSRIFARFCVGK